MAKQKKDQVDSGLRSLLSHPVIYKTFQRVIGIDRAFRKYISEIIQPLPGSRILDIGCGEGYILDFLPADITYVGYDMNPAYIEFAQKKYGNRGRFIPERVSNMSIADHQPFDIVLATGLLHHLNDDEGRDLFRNGYDSLKNGGTMYTYDNCFYEEQSAIARFISSKDRGQHIRYPEQYRQIALKVFSDVELQIRENMIRIPQTICILKCSKPQ